jgi:hypothetical protein
MRELVALKRIKRDEFETRTAAILLAAKLYRVERLPSLDELLRAGRPMTREEIRAKFEAAGYTVRTHNPKKYRIVRSYPKAS